jgi:hypothetical protein
VNTASVRNDCEQRLHALWVHDITDVLVPALDRQERVVQIAIFGRIIAQEERYIEDLLSASVL